MSAVSRETLAFAQTQALSVDSETRTISGTIIPFGAVAENRGGLWQFQPGSITWGDVSRIKMNADHDHGSTFGRALEVTSDDTGVHGRFKIGRSALGSEQLMSAEDGIADGLSAEVDITTFTVERNAAGQDVRVVTAATLTGVALTPTPAFADARVLRVAASTTGGTTMTTTTAQSSAEQALQAFTAAIQALTDRLPTEQAADITPGTVSVVDPMVYSLDGTGESFVRDSWTAVRGNFTDRDAAVARLRKYSEQTAALAVQFANAGNTTDQAQLIPPGYRPDLYVGQLPVSRPLHDSIGTRVTLANATPFKVPVWVGSAGLNGTNVEGTGPSTGTITNHTYRTVTPTAQSGEFVMSREVIDASNPAIDVIAMNAMRQEYASDTEAIIAAALAAAVDDGTPVMGTSSTSSEGCYVYAVTGPGSNLATEGIRLMEAEFPAHRQTTPDRLLASPTAYAALAKAVDDIGRPLFPFIGASNAQGTVGRAAQSLQIDGMAVPQAWAMTSTYLDLLLFDSTDLLVGESPMLTFRFEEKSGPESIVLNTWGYHAFQILRYSGVHACNYTA